MSESLVVLRAGEPIAHLDRVDDRLSLSFVDNIIGLHDHEILISASLRVRARPYAEPELLPFFDGLLPEGAARERLAARFRLDYNDVFGLLREIGRDCAGALSIVPGDTNIQALSAEGVDWLDPADLANLVANLELAPLGVDPERDVRISLAGLQDKVVVVVGEDDRIGKPRGTTPSTHILKPAPRARFPELVQNEAFCLALATHAGLRTVEFDLLRIADAPALLVRRYDRRTLGDGTVVRVHQEDFCQALRVSSRRKYQSQGGPDNRRILDLLRDISSDAAEDIDEFMSRLAFNYMIGNADAHAKNHALVYGREFRLAPAYDLVSTELYADLKRDLATSIGDEYVPDRIGPEHWRRELRRLGLNQDRFAEMLRGLADRVQAAIPRAQEWLENKHASLSADAALAELVWGRAAVLGSIGSG